MEGELINIKRVVVKHKSGVKELIVRSGECVGWYKDVGQDEYGRFKTKFYYKDEGWELDQ